MRSFPITGSAIETLIPQRDPMVMVSSLESYEEKSLVTTFRVERACIFVADGKLMESGLLEHMAQAVALHTGYSYFLRGEQAPVGYIGAMPKVEIRALPRVNDVVVSTIEIMQEFMGITLVEIESKVNGETIASARMKTVIA